jgi:predicted amidohydrolase YtcJ
MNSFNDSHLHFVGIGINKLEYIDLGMCNSHQEVLDRLQEQSKRDFIIARGFHEENFKEKAIFTKSLINELRENIPVVVIRTCGHVLVCNDAMMKLAGIDETSEQISGGTFDYKTGIFTENTLGVIYDKIPKPNKERIKEYMIAANEELLSHGITACGSDDFSTINVDYEIIIDAYRELYLDGLLDVRIYEQVNIPEYEELRRFIEKGYHKLEFGRFKMGPLKLLADGSLGGRTAYLKEPYSDDESNRGVSVFEEEELNKLIYLADKNGMDVAIHGIGDGVIDMIIQGIEASLSKTKRRGHRHSIIHNQLANREQINKMKELNIGAQVQPIFLNSDIPIIESRLGNRSKETYLFNTMFKEIPTTISTDSPVEPLNPFYNLYCAVARKSIKHETEPFLVEESIKLEDAIKAYTVNPYYLSYDEEMEFDDYIMIDNDILNVKEDKLLDTVVCETYMDGKLVYKRK